MSVWDKAAVLEAEENVGDSVWDKAGDPIAEKQRLHRNLTDALLDNKHIESFLATKLPDTPLGYEPVPEDKERLLSIINSQENPQEYRDRLAVSLYLSNAYDMEFRDIYNRYDAVSKELWGKTTPSAALEKILKADREAFDLNRSIDYKGFIKATKHAYSQAGVGMVSEVAGIARIVGELRSGWSAGQVEWAENLNDWGKMMYKGVEEYYREHPEEFIQAQGDGFWDTTAAYLGHPVAIYQGVLQTMPLVLEGLAGGVAAGGLAATLGAGAKTVKFTSWLGRVQGMAAPITGRKYAELRSLDVAPSRALPQAFLTGQAEAIIEEWTLGKKLAIFKGAGAQAKKLMVGRVLATIIGGSKAYGRGVLEEGSQQFSENFWNWVFTDRDQKWMTNVMSQAAAGGPMEAVMAGGFAVAGKGYAAIQGKGQVSAEEKLRRVEVVREAMLNAELSPAEAAEINKVCDDVKDEITEAKTKTVESLAKELEKSLNLSPEKALEVATKKLAYDVEKAAEPEVPKEPQNISEEIDQTPRFGVQPSKDGKTFAIIDWETQTEVETSKGERHAVFLANEYNKGTLIPAIPKRASLLPSEKETFTIRQVLNYVMKGMSKAARQGYMQGARDVLTMHKDLAKYANQKLKGLDITKGQRRRLMSAVASAKTDAQKVVILATIDVLAEQAHQAKAIKTLKKTITYINRKIGVIMQKKGIREEFYERIKALTDTFLMKPNSAKQQRAIRSLKIHLENLQKNTSNRYESQYETELIPDSLIKRLDKINAVPIQSMTTEQIEALNDTLKLLVHLNNTKNRLIKDRIARDLKKTLDGAVEEVDRVNDISVDETKYPTTEQATGKYGALHSFVTIVAGAKNHDIETLVDTLSGGQMGWAYEIFVEGMAEGREKAYAYSNRIKDEFKSAMAEASIELKDLQKMSKSFLRILKGKRGMSMRRFLGQIFGEELTPTLHTIKIAGKDQQFTMGELMMIYMHAQADFNLKALIDQGAASWKKRLGKMTPAEIVSTTDVVEKDSKAKAMVEMAAKVYETIAKVEINKTSVALIGISLAKEDNYAHVERYKTGGVGGAQRYRLSDLEQEGRIQSRVGSKEPVIIRDFFEVFFNDMQAISQYVGMAEPLRNARNLVNYKVWRDKLVNKGYAEQLGLLDQMLHNVQALPEGGDAIDAIASSLMRGTVRAVLAEPGIFLGQYTSLNGIFNEVSHKYSSAIRVKATEKDKTRYKEHFSSYKARLEGGVSSVTLSYLAQNDAVLRAFANKADFISFFTRLIHEVDALAITDICRVTEAEMQDANRRGRSKDYWEGRNIDPSQLKIGSQEYWNAFVKRASYLIRRTQPMFTPENRSIFTSEKSAAKRMWFLFRSYVDQPLRMASRSMTAYKHGKVSLGQLSADLANIWATLALYAVVRFGVGIALYRRDDDWKDLVVDMMLAPVRVLTLIGFPLQMIIEQAFEATRAPKIGTVPIGFANKMAESLTWLSKGAGHLITEERYESGPNKDKLKGPIEIERGLILLLENALMFYGVPEDVPRRAYKGWTERKDKQVKYTAF